MTNYWQHTTAWTHLPEHLLVLCNYLIVPGSLCITISISNQSLTDLSTCCITLSYLNISNRKKNILSYRFIGLYLQAMCLSSWRHFVHDSCMEKPETDSYCILFRCLVLSVVWLVDHQCIRVISLQYCDNIVSVSVEGGAVSQSHDDDNNATLHTLYHRKHN